MGPKKSSVTGVTVTVTVKPPSRCSLRSVTARTKVLVRPSRCPSRSVTAPVTVTLPLSL